MPTLYFVFLKPLYCFAITVPLSFLSYWNWTHFYYLSLTIFLVIFPFLYHHLNSSSSSHNINFNIVISINTTSYDFLLLIFFVLIFFSRVLFSWSSFKLLVSDFPLFDFIVCFLLHLLFWVSICLSFFCVSISACEVFPTVFCWRFSYFLSLPFSYFVSLYFI